MGKKQSKKQSNKNKTKTKSGGSTKKSNLSNKNKNKTKTSGKNRSNNTTNSTKSASKLYGKDSNKNAYPIRGKGGEKVRCAFYCASKSKGDRLLYAQFSPEGFEFERSATYAEITSPGMNYPVFQFVRGNSYRIDVELFFYDLPKGKHGDALEYACKWLMSLLPPQKNKGVGKSKKSKIPMSYTPPTVDFRMGVFKQKVVFEKVRKKYTRMNKKGKMNVGSVVLTMIRVGSNSHF